MVLGALGRAGLGLWAGYNRSLAARPLLTKSLTSFSGFVVGDGIAQLATNAPGRRYDWARTARFAAFGFLLHAPGCHVFYRALDALVFPGAPTSTKAVLAKMLVDQTLWTPFSICAFYAFLLAAEGRAEAVGQTIRDKFWPTLLAGYAVWPLAHIINFRFVPNSHRLLYINCVQVGWNVVLSRIATAGAPAPAARKEKAERPEPSQLEEGLAGALDLAQRRRQP